MYYVNWFGIILCVLLCCYVECRPETVCDADCRFGNDNGIQIPIKLIISNNFYQRFFFF